MSRAASATALAVVALLLSTGAAGAATATPGPTVIVVEPEAGPPVDLPVHALDAPRLDLFLVTGPVDGAVTDAVAQQEQLFTASADVFFAFDAADLSERARSELVRIAEQVADAGLTSVRIVGHTDAEGDDPYNLALSGRRAEAVRAFLADQLPGASLTAEGVGEAQPVAPESIDGQDNPEGRAANRRVEIRAEP